MYSHRFDVVYDAEAKLQFLSIIDFFLLLNLKEFSFSEIAGRIFEFELFFILELSRRNGVDLAL